MVQERTEMWEKFANVLWMNLWGRSEFVLKTRLYIAQVLGTMRTYASIAKAGH